MSSIHNCSCLPKVSHLIAERASFSPHLQCCPCRCVELVQTKLGAHLEERVNSFLSQHGAADVEVAVRVLSCTSRSTEVKSYMRHRFPEAPTSFPYTAKGIFAFQKINGKDVCFFGLHTQEYGSDAPQPNHRLYSRAIITDSHLLCVEYECPLYVVLSWHLF